MVIGIVELMDEFVFEGIFGVMCCFGYIEGDVEVLVVL